MAEENKRVAISLGFTMHMQTIGVTGIIDSEEFVNVWGGRYERLNYDEAVRFEAQLNAECGDELDAFIKKARGVAAEFGLNETGQKETKRQG
jgi:hypothetical protein